MPPDTAPDPAASAPAPASTVIEHVVVERPTLDTAARQEVLNLRPSWRAELHDAVSSKKLWVLLLTLVAIVTAVFQGKLDWSDGIRDVVIATGTYFVGQGIGDRGKP